MIPRLHLILDLAELASSGRDPVAVAVAAAQGGAGAVHLRGYGYPAGELLALTRALQTALSCQALLLVNDRLDVALAGDADGVQLPGAGLPVPIARTLARRAGRSEPLFLIGCSVHTADEASQAERSGADFALLGTVFASASHPGATPGGVPLVRAACAATRLPLIAIGGITPRTAGQAIAAGADGVAAIRAITEAADPSAAAAALLRAVDLAYASRASSAAKPEPLPQLPVLPPNLLDLAHGEGANDDSHSPERERARAGAPDVGAGVPPAIR